MRAASSFHSKKDQMVSAKGFRISMDLKSFVRMGDACVDFQYLSLIHNHLLAKGFRKKRKTNKTKPSEKIIQH